MFRTTTTPPSSFTLMTWTGWQDADRDPSGIKASLQPVWTKRTHLSVDGAALLHDGVEARRLVGVLASGGARRSGGSGLVSAGRLWDRCRQRAGQFCSAVRWKHTQIDHQCTQHWIILPLLRLHSIHVTLRSKKAPPDSAVWPKYSNDSTDEKPNLIWTINLLNRFFHTS